MVIAARAQKKPSGSTDTAKVRQQPGDAPIKGDRSLKRKRPSQPSMSVSSAIKGLPHHNLTSLLYNLRNHCGRMCDFSHIYHTDHEDVRSFAEPRSVRYTDLGGIEAVLHDIRELVEYPLQHPEVRP